jgi:tetratricopeptide (TPR) repeat protein
VKRVFWFALVVAGSLTVSPRLLAQAPANNDGQNKPAGEGQKPAESQKPAATTPQSGSNPFPEDTTAVPVIPSKTTPDTERPSFSERDADTDGARVPLASGDADPVRSPDDPSPVYSGNQDEGSSSSLKGMEDLQPPPDSDEPGKKHKKEPTHQEAAAEDISVGGYYLDKKNWKAAMSRFQSAMVLDPENPDVYWGLAEAEHHMGDLANARAHYEKVLDYDPDGPHGKQARKALKDPALAAAHSVGSNPIPAPGPQ